MTENKGIQSRVLDRVRESTGFPVIVQKDAALPVRASLQSARPGQPGHVIVVNPRYESQIDYWVVVECLQVLRLWAVPYERQRDFRLSEEKQRHLIARLSNLPTYKQLNRQVVSTAAAQQFTGITRQLRSMPCDVRVNQTVLREYSMLEEQQRAAVVAMLQENSQCLRPEIARMTTQQILNANASMNAAYALFWARAWGDRSILLPYEASGFQSNAERLLAILDAEPDRGGVEDASLVDAWAREFHMETWYVWAEKVSERS